MYQIVCDKCGNVEELPRGFLHPRRTEVDPSPIKSVEYSAGTVTGSITHGPAVTVDLCPACLVLVKAALVQAIKSC